MHKRYKTFVTLGSHLLGLGVVDHYPSMIFTVTNLVALKTKSNGISVHISKIFQYWSPSLSVVMLKI